jgi:dihydroneopterin triphosphate diphosphatase
MKRVAREVSVHLFRVAPAGPRFLMLRRLPQRGGFWQSVTGAPFHGETELDAAAREVREETGFDVRATLRPVGVTYSYALDPRTAHRWEEIYGPGVASIAVVAFAAEVPHWLDPVLDPREHDAFVWCGYDEAMELLDWPIEADALDGRRQALRTTARAIQNRESEGRKVHASPETPGLRSGQVLGPEEGDRL